MKALVSIIMGSTSDLPAMQEAARILDQFGIAFEMQALSAHRTPHQVVEYVGKAVAGGVKVFIAGASGAAHLPGVIAALTSNPVIGVPLTSSISLDGWDSILSILQMPGGIPVATVALNGALNAGLLAAQILAVGDADIHSKVVAYKASLEKKIVKANEELANVKYDCKVN